MSGFAFFVRNHFILYIMFKAPFSFSGRIRRTEYGISLIINSILNFFLTAIIGSTNGDAAILLVLYIPMLWFIWAQGAKRSHDRGNSGWYQLIPFYPLVLLFGEGEIGPNRYGEDPKNRNLQGGYSSNNNSSSSQGSDVIYNGGHNAGYSNSSNSGYNTNYNSNSQYTNQEGSSGEFSGNNPYAKN